MTTVIKPGLDAQSPDPMRATRVRVRTVRAHHAGDSEVSEVSIRWGGYTAKEALANRLHRLREARADVTREGMTLTIRHVRDEWVETETLTFEDATND